jgi:biopolymer transport protein ExbD
MASIVQNRSGAITGINVTPLVDITLVLLIVFMVTAKLIVSNKAMPLDLPRAATGDEVQEVFRVAIPSSGDAQVNGARVAVDDDILQLARAAHERKAALRVVIDADGGVSHRRVMHVLDLVRRAGIARVGFGVVPETDAHASGAP